MCRVDQFIQQVFIEQLSTEWCIWHDSYQLRWCSVVVMKICSSNVLPWQHGWLMVPAGFLGLPSWLCWIHTFSGLPSANNWVCCWPIPVRCSTSPTVILAQWLFIGLAGSFWELLCDLRVYSIFLSSHSPFKGVTPASISSLFSPSPA